MPPEATGVKPEYDTKLDMFSFGHLALYVVAQEFPANLLPPTYSDPASEKLLARSEIDRRLPFIEKMNKCLHKKHTLSTIVMQCLNNFPKKRPDADTVMKQLEGLVDSDSDPCKGMSRLEMLHIIVGKGSLSRSRVDQIRSGQPGALQIQRTSAFMRRVRWKSYVFQITNSTHLQCIGSKHAVKRSVQLSDIQEVVPCPSLSEPGRSAFELKIYGRPSWILSAFSEEEKSCWMEAIFMPDSSGPSSPISDDTYEEMHQVEESTKQQNLDLYDYVHVDIPVDDTDEHGYEYPSKFEAKPLPISTNENVAYDVSDVRSKIPKVKQRPHIPPVSLQPLKDVEPDPIEEDSYHHLNPNNVSFKCPSPGDQQQKAKLYVDPSQLEMLMEMLQSADPTVKIADDSKRENEADGIRPRSSTHPPSIPTKPFVKLLSEGDDPLLEDDYYEEDSDDGNGGLYHEIDDEDDDNGDLGGAKPTYDDVVTPLKKEDPLDLYANIMDDEWNTQLKRAVVRERPTVPPKPKLTLNPKPRYENLPDSKEFAPPVPPRIQSRPTSPPISTDPRRNTSAFGDMHRPTGKMGNGSSAARHLEKNGTRMPRPRQPHVRHNITATQERLAKHARKLSSDRFLVAEDDNEVQYITRPGWAKARTSTLSPEDSLAALHREALFIQRPALQSLVKIGQGQFGVVYKALLLRENGARCKVAVKTIKKYKSEKETEEFLKEMSIMSELVHPNIVRLYGLVEQESPWIVLELLPLGDLKKFLMENRRPVSKLIKYMLDVAMGMHYIAEKGLIHRDLAARNIILGKNEQCKVSDFGLLRELPKDDTIYIATTKSKWPIRWLAPESLERREFSSASDVWSFGVLQWEMYFPTKTPYDELGDNMQCSINVCKGYRLSVPRDYSPMMARIMKSCWNSNPAKRPSFLLISTLLTNLTFGE